MCDDGQPIRLADPTAACHDRGNPIGSACVVTNDGNKATQLTAPIEFVHTAGAVSPAGEGREEPLFRIPKPDHLEMAKVRPPFLFKT
jgi:hypothetical protein